MTIGDRIKAARERAGLTQEELARALGVSIPTVCKYEKDRIPLTTVRVEQIAACMGADPAELVGWERK